MNIIHIQILLNGVTRIVLHICFFFFFKGNVGISYEDHVTNEEVRVKIQQASRPHEDLLTIVKKRKLQWYCHVSRSSGLAKPSRKVQ